MPDRNFQRAGTPSVHAAGWDPTSSGRTWSSTYMTIDGRSSRVAPSRQRARDGQVFRDRAETLLMGAEPVRGLGQHPEIVKDGGPRFPKPNQGTATNPNGDPGCSYVTSYQAFYASPIESVSPTKPDRHNGATRSHLTPNIYAALGREKSMPMHVLMASRGNAFTPTLGDWTNPPGFTYNGKAYRMPMPANEEDYSIKMMEAQLRSEQRLRSAAMALAADKIIAEEQRAAARTITPMHASGALTARF